MKKIQIRQEKFFQITLIACYFLFAIDNFTIPSYGQDDSDELGKLSQICFKQKQINICHKALAKVEYYQNLFAAKNNYSCQTRLLALGSDLIVSSLQRDVSNYNLSLKNVYQYCNGLR